MGRSFPRRWEIMGGVVLGTVGNSQRISWVLRATDSMKGLDCFRQYHANMSLWLFDGLTCVMLKESLEFLDAATAVNRRLERYKGGSETSSMQGRSR